MEMSMATFGDFFNGLRQRIEKTGRTDSQCGDMDRYRSRRRIESLTPFRGEDVKWKEIANQELSHSNLLDFALYMAQAGLGSLATASQSDRFDPDHFGWQLDALHEFQHAMLEEARTNGLNIDSPSAWLRARGVNV
jgi:hypothetical protein